MFLTLGALICDLSLSAARILPKIGITLRRFLDARNITDLGTVLLTRRNTIYMPLYITLGNAVTSAAILPLPLPAFLASTTIITYNTCI